MGQLHIIENEIERVLLVGAQLGRDQTAHSVNDSLDELELLCETAGAAVAERMIVRMPKPHSGTFIGTGKAKEIADLVKEQGIATVVFDDDLHPVQARELEALIMTKVIDRTQVILDIFAQRARTSEGKMQIELAQLEYLLPRLRRMWTHLERQRGGIGMHGPGEKQLEMDRRRIEEKIERYQKLLEKVRTRRNEVRRGRHRHGWAVISLVGYTNAGKSTLLNALTGAEVFAQNKLFATLDPTTRQMKLPNNQQALLTDTVGFIRKLPHGIVESFKATLEEVVESDILIHVIDASHPMVEEQIKAVNEVLGEIGVHGKPIIPALNKIDLISDKALLRRLADVLPGAVNISAKKGTGLDSLQNAVADQLRNRNVQLKLRISASEGRALATIRAQGTVYSQEYDGETLVVEVSVPVRLAGMFSAYAVGEPVEKEE